MKPRRKMADQQKPPAASPANASELRQAIDSGRTGDKVRAEDPSAVPLGTNDEAAGHTPRSGEVGLAMEHEVGRSAPPRSPAGTRRLLLAAMVVVAVLGLLAAVLTAEVWLA